MLLNRPPLVNHEAAKSVRGKMRSVSQFFRKLEPSNYHQCISDNVYGSLSEKVLRTISPSSTSSPCNRPTLRYQGDAHKKSFFILYHTFSQIHEVALCTLQYAVILVRRRANLTPTALQTMLSL